MHRNATKPGLTAAMTAGRHLLAAGWRYDSTTPMADDTTIRTLLHPSGREIHARTVDRDGDDTTTLTMTGLDLTQVADAITGAGLVEPTGQPTDDEIADEIDRAFAEPDPRVDLADALRSLALDIVDFKLPLPRYYFTLRACLQSRAEVQAWADHYGVPVTMGGTAGDIPCADQDIEFGDGRSIRIAVQGPTEQAPDPEKAALRAELEQLRAQLAAPTNPDRRCHRCGATSGLRLIPGNPLTLADREWQCIDQCEGGAR